MVNGAAEGWVSKDLVEDLRAVSWWVGREAGWMVVAMSRHVGYASEKGVVS